MRHVDTMPDIPFSQPGAFLPGGRVISQTECRALLAYRDKVAAGLEEWEQEVLIADVLGPPKQWGAAVGAALEYLKPKGLLGTPFGREIARVLSR